MLVALPENPRHHPASWPESSGRSSAWLERQLWELEVVGSNPAAPTTSPPPIKAARLGITITDFRGGTEWDAANCTRRMQVSSLKRADALHRQQHPFDGQLSDEYNEEFTACLPNLSRTAEEFPDFFVPFVLYSKRITRHLTACKPSISTPT